VAERRELVLARFPFTDMSDAKLRPLLVLAEVPGSFRDFLVMFVSSQLNQAVPGLDLVLDANHPAFAATGLKVASVFRTAKIATLSEALLVGSLGRLDPALFDEVVGRLTDLLQANPPRTRAPI
jgi:mRNA interferase MazF